MKSEGNGIDVEEACRTLGVPRDASREAIEEAYRDLGEVWNPRRFEADDRLRRRAEEQLRRVEEAYRFLKKHSHHALIEDLYQERRHAPPPQAVRPPKTNGKPEQEQTSLIDVVFADQPAKKKQNHTWYIVLGVIAVAAIGAILLNQRGETKQTDSGSLSEGGAAPVAELSTSPAESGSEIVPPVQLAPTETPGTQPPLPSEPATPASAPNERSVSPTAPPPQPRTVEPQVQRRNREDTSETAPSRPAAKRMERTPAPSVEASTDDKPKLVRGPDDGRAAQEKERKSFDLLLEKSTAARLLFEGQIEQVRFLEWQALPKEAGQFWIDLIAALEGTPQPVHFIWAVDPDKQAVRAMSQGARDLEARIRRM